MGEKLKKDVGQELSGEEMEKTAGGDIFDSIECLFSGHTWDIQAEKGYTDNDTRVRCYRCINCGKNHYKDGKELVEMSAEELIENQGFTVFDNFTLCSTRLRSVELGSIGGRFALRISLKDSW